jgi:hypothetical protein
MAKHEVKCLYCGKMLDINIEEFVKPRSNRYAHKSCHDKLQASKTKEEQDIEALYEYIKNLFGYKKIPSIVIKQINKYATENEYTYSGMLKTLKYHYEVKHGDIDKAEGRVGIIPYQYDNARRYYYSIWLAQQQNTNLNINDYVLPQRVVHITAPERKPMQKFKKLFSFLDDNEPDITKEENNNNGV